MNAPVTTERKSFLPLRLRSSTVTGSSNIPTATRQTTPVTTSMPLAAQHESRPSFVVGNRVLVNGLKLGTLRYIGKVQFAQGLFCGIELDEPDGKHDGEVNDIRYFQCQNNHGVFVPCEKVILAPRERSFSSQRFTGRLKPPTMTRSMTVSSSNDSQLDQLPVQKPAQLPDIIPSPSNSTQSISSISHEILPPTEDSPPIFIKSSIEPPSVPIDEHPGIIEADFTDSVSLFLHQLQQDPTPLLSQPRSSITISEEGTIDDLDDDNATDQSDRESVAESIRSERVPEPVHRLSDSTKPSLNPKETIKVINNTLANSRKSLASSTTSVNKLRINPTESRPSIPKKKPTVPTTPVVIEKKDIQRKGSTPLVNLSATPRKSFLIPPKNPSSPITKVNSMKSIALLGSQTKLNQSPSSSNSLNSSHSDLTSSQQRLSKLAVRPKPALTRPISHSIDLTSDKKGDSSRHSLGVQDHQLVIQKVIIQSLETTNERYKKQYQHLLNQFDLMTILNQYSFDQTEQIKHRYEMKFTRVQKENTRLKTSIEQIQIAHRNQLETADEQHHNEIELIKDTHREELVEYQQQIEELTKEKGDLEVRCTSSEEQVERFLEEMRTSEHADPLLRRVETLEKDTTSLQTVVEMRNQELTLLRTKINEQVFQREDQLALQKRIDMAENRNEDLQCLLRNWQLNEKAVTVERDQLKEQLAQLERDNQQLSFENETLRYGLRQRSLAISLSPVSHPTITSDSAQTLRNRTRSLPSILRNTHHHEPPKRISSLNCLLSR